MRELCAQSNCTFWVDMELFRADMSSGLLPKDFAGVAQELVRLSCIIELQVGITLVVWVVHLVAQ